MLEICQKLRESREASHLTQEELGMRIGKSKQWVSGLERGNIRLTYECAIAIASVYGKTPDFFLPCKSIINRLDNGEQNKDTA